MLKVGVIGEYNSTNETHVATDAAIAHAAAALGEAAMVTWAGTEEVAAGGAGELRRFDCLVVSPGSPYRSTEGALAAIAHARTADVPLLGTCGGFQHIVLELARDVLGYADAEHAEHDPDADHLFLVPVACSVRGQALPVELVPGSRAARAYAAPTAMETYYCSFELNVEYLDELVGAGMVVSGTGPAGEPRLVELPALRFFVGSLFVPQVSSTTTRPHPLVTGLLAAAL